MQNGIMCVSLFRPNKISTTDVSGTGSVQGHRSKNTTFRRQNTRIIGHGNTEVSVLRPQNIAGHFPDRIFIRIIMTKIARVRFARTRVTNMFWRPRLTNGMQNGVVTTPVAQKVRHLIVHPHKGIEDNYV